MALVDKKDAVMLTSAELLELEEGDRIIVTLPVVVNVIGFHGAHVWVETEDGHSFAFRSTSNVFIERTEK